MLEPTQRFSFGLFKEGCGTAHAMPLIREAQVMVGAFCFDREEWLGLFFHESSNDRLTCARLPGGFETSSVDAHLRPLAYARNRIAVVLQFASIDQRVVDSSVLAVYQPADKSWFVWRRAMRAVSSEVDGVISWLAPNAIELLNLDDGKLIRSVPIPLVRRIDTVASDRMGTLVAFASGKSVTCLTADGATIAHWSIPVWCIKLRFSDDGDLFAFTRDGGLVQLKRSSSECINRSMVGAFAVEVDPAGLAGFFASQGLLRQVELETGKVIASAATSPDVAIDIDPRTNAAVVVDRSAQTAQVLHFPRLG